MASLNRPTGLFNFQKGMGRNAFLASANLGHDPNQRGIATLFE